MAKLTTFIDQDTPRIDRVTLEFDNGRIIRIPARRIERQTLLQWLGPDEDVLIAEIRLIFKAEQIGLELEPLADALRR